MSRYTGDELSKLEIEMALGNRAQKSYNAYLKDLYELERLKIFNEFCNAHVDDIDQIKHLQIALDRMEQVTLTHIDTGKMANKMLNEDK